MLNEKLAQLRKSRGWSQEQLAEMLSVSRQAVSKWETGESLPDTGKLAALADIFNVSLDELFGRQTGEVSKKTSGTQTPGKHKLSSLMLAIVLVSCLVVGGVAGYLIRKGEYDPSFINDMKITSFSFERISSGNTSCVIRIALTPSRTNEDQVYHVKKLDSLGNETVYPASYEQGICVCSIDCDYGVGFTLALVVGDRKSTYNYGLMKVDSINRDTIEYDELWSQP